MYLDLPLALTCALVRSMWLWAPAEQGGGGQTGEINWLLEAPWAKVALLVALAVGVMFFASQRSRANKRRGARPPDFDLRVAKLEALPLVAIAEAKSGDVHLAGTVIKGEGALGTGPRACVYQNRARGSRATAIAALLVFVEDESGVIGLEGLDDARVIAPKEELGAHDTLSLYLGDRIELVGELMTFDTPQTVDDKPLLGMLGSLGPIQVRVIERPDPDPDPQDLASETA